MSARVGSNAPQRPGVIKIHSHSTQFSFWTVPLDANTRATDVVQVVANKIMLPPEHVFLYERKLAPDELLEPLYKKWTAEKSNKKFSINVEGLNMERLRTGASKTHLDAGAATATDKRASGSFPNAVSDSNGRTASPDRPQPSDHSGSSNSLAPAPQSAQRHSSPTQTPSVQSSIPASSGMSGEGHPQSSVTTTNVAAGVKPQTYMIEDVRPTRVAAPQRAIISPSVSALTSDKRAPSPTMVRHEVPQPVIAVLPPHNTRSEHSPGPQRPPRAVPTEIVLTPANPKPAPPAASAQAKLQPSLSSYAGVSVPQPQVAVIRPNLNALQAEQRSQSPFVGRSQTPTRPVPRHEESAYNSALAEALDPATIADYATKLRSIAVSTVVGAGGQADLNITPDIVTQLDNVYSAAFNRPPTGSDYGKIYALLTQAEDASKEHTLRILTHITLQIDNQKAVASSGMLKPLVQLVAQGSPNLQMLSAWTISNLATFDANKDKLRDAIPALIALLAGNSAPPIEQALRAFANLLKGNEANKTVFARNYGVSLTVNMLRRKELGENPMVLSLRVLMLLTWNAETKSAAFAAGGLHSVLDLLNHSNAGVRKMASWIANNMVVDGTVNDDVRRLGGIVPMVKLLSENDPFVKEQAVTVLANLAVNEANLDPLREAGGLKALLAVAASKESSDNLRLKAVWAISNAVVSDENQNAFQDLGGIKFLMHFLANPQVKVQVRAAAACVNLTQSSDSCRAEIGASGGVSRLVQCLGQNHAELEEHVMKAFVNLSLSAANEDRFVNEALDALLARVQSQNVATVEYALMTLANLALNDRVRTEVRERNGLVTVVVVFLNPPSDLARFQSLKLLTNLSINGKNRAFLAKKGLIPRVNQYVDRSNDPAMRELATMAYANLTFPVEEPTAPVNTYMKALVEEGAARAQTLRNSATLKRNQIRSTAMLEVPSSGAGYSNQRSGGGLRKETDLFAQQREEAEAELRALQREREEYLASVRREDEKKKDEARRLLEEQKAEEAAAASLPPALLTARREKSAKYTQDQLDPARQAEEERKKKEKVAAMIEKRGRIAAEILVSERTYVESLSMMIKKYMNPMLAAAQSKKPPVTDLQVKKIFSISELILNFHSMFLEGLEARILSWSEETLIGDYFLRMAEFLRCYTQYVNNYDTAMKILEDLEKKPLFVQLLQKCTDNTELKGLALYSYLIMPIQRPPRYELLLADLLKNTVETHADYNNIKDAQQLICDINAQVDEKKRVNDEKKRVVEIDKSVGGQPAGETLVAAHRNFLTEGDLVSGADRFHVFLFTDLVVFTKPRPVLKKRDSAIGLPTDSPMLWDFVMRVPLGECQISEVSTFLDNSDCAFRLQTSQNISLLLHAPSKEERDSWFGKISDALNVLTTSENKRRSMRVNQAP